MITLQQRCGAPRPPIQNWEMTDFEPKDGICGWGKSHGAVVGEELDLTRFLYRALVLSRKLGITEGLMAFFLEADENFTIHKRS